MEKVKESGEYTILKKRSGRHAVQDAKGAFLHGEEKIKLLTKEGLLKPPAVKKAKPEGEKPAEGEKA